MLTQSLSLSFLTALPLAMATLVASGWDFGRALQVALLSAAAALAWGGIQQFNLNLHIIDGKIDRARFVPWRPSPIVDVPPSPPVVSPPNTLNNTLRASRSITFNANGQSGQLSLEPASSDLVAFLDNCIRISSAGALRFPPVLDLKHIGIPYEQQDNMYALLGDAVIRKDRRPTLIKNGYTLGDLRRMAAGG